MLQSKEKIGRMDYRITFQQKVVGENESNEDEEEGWEDIATNPDVWASKTDRAVSSGEEYRADKLTGYQNTVFVCRYRSDITVKNTLVCRGLRYNILSIQDIGRRRYMSLDAEYSGEEVETVETGAAFSSAFSGAFNS